jgi:PAS domain S-box-containing protein
MTSATNVRGEVGDPVPERSNQAATNHLHDQASMPDGPGARTSDGTDWGDAPNASEPQRVSLATMAAGPRARRVALAVVILSALAFAVAIPFARVPLPKVPAFIASYESALILNDLITAILLFGQFNRTRSRAFLALASGYLFDALIIIPHALTFPGVFSPNGLLGANDQTTAWLYVFWHGGFPLFALAYAVLAGRPTDDLREQVVRAVGIAIVIVVASVCALTMLATSGHNLLPVIIRDGDYSLLITSGVGPAVWCLTLVALIALWRRRSMTVLDLWLLVVLCAWVFDIALSTLIDTSRYGLGWYGGRIYGLLAASFVLAVLLLETNELHGRLASAKAQLEDHARQLERRIREGTAEIRQSEQRLRAVVDNAVDGLINIDERGVIEAFNPACERIFGYTAADVIGRNIKMLMPEPYHSAHDGYIGHYLATGEAKIIGTTGREVSAKRKDGSVFPMDLAIGAFTLADGRHFCGIIRDITLRKHGEETVALLAAIVASSDDAILSKTVDGVITSWNAGAERLFGYRTAEAIGEHIRLIVPSERWAEEENLIAQIRNGKSIDHYETVRIAKDGRRIDISASISPIRDKAGHVVGAAKVARDITERKRYEAELTRHVGALERSNKELDDFAYIASHDLKEPLRGLFNNAKFLQEDYADKLDQEGVNRLLRLGYLCQRMEQLVNDLLYFSRLGRQDLAIQPTDLNAVIRDIELMSETTLKERHASIIVPRELPRISCDKTRITEVFRNLIVNAVKYNDNDVKHVEIGFLPTVETMHGTARDVFYVRDNGIGIDKEFYEEIFRIFKRLNAEDDDKKGTGVGLTFVRKIVERHGGRIWLESVPGEGTTFYFTIEQGAAYEAAA